MIRYSLRVEGPGRLRLEFSDAAVRAVFDEVDARELRDACLAIAELCRDLIEAGKLARTLRQ